MHISLKEEVERKDNDAFGNGSFLHNNRSVSLLESKRSKISASFLKTSCSTFIGIQKEESDSKALLDFSEAINDNSDISQKEQKLFSFSCFLCEDITKGLSICFRENMLMPENCNLIDATIKFTEHFNTFLEANKYRFRILLVGALKNPYEFSIKPMKKKNGKPNMDYPNFELIKKLAELNHDSFSIIYTKSCFAEASSSSKSSKNRHQHKTLLDERQIIRSNNSSLFKKSKQNSMNRTNNHSIIEESKTCCKCSIF